MAEETTPKTTQATDNSKKISAMPELTTAQGLTLVPVVDGGNKKVKLSTIKSYINEGMVAQQAGKSLSTNDYSDGEKAKLGALPTNDELETSLAGKQAAFTTSDELSMSAQNKLSLTDKAKMAPLIERAEACGVVYNRKTGYFSHNGIDDLTAAEVSDMLAHVNEIFLPGGRRLQTLKARTNIVTASSYTTGWNADFVNLDGVCGRNEYIGVLKIGDCQVSKESQLICLGYQCRKLRKVIGVLDLSQVTRCRDPFRFALNLEEVTLDSLRISISFADCPLLTLSSLQYLVNNAANTTAITVTVHPDVYAKLTDESNAEWYAVLTAAEARQIEFATTE